MEVWSYLSSVDARVPGVIIPLLADFAVSDGVCSVGCVSCSWKGELTARAWGELAWRESACCLKLSFFSGILSAKLVQPPINEIAVNYYSGRAKTNPVNG